MRWDLYTGKVYGIEASLGLKGLEVPTRHYELWETQDILIRSTDPASTPHASATRETMAIVHSF
jgi:hypothetical protein